MAFADFRNAFDSTLDDVIWKSVFNYGVHSELVKLLKSSFVEVDVCHQIGLELNYIKMLYLSSVVTRSSQTLDKGESISFVEKFSYFGDEVSFDVDN